MGSGQQADQQREPRPLRVLALEPYYGGSHRAFLDGWIEHSHHRWTLLGLPAHNWKWRMRHAAVSLAQQAGALLAEGEQFDLIFASDMLNLAEFVGLAPAEIGHLPRVVYFHENQLTYPDRRRAERDFHYAFTNFTSALAADRVWFNSQYHWREFYTAMGDLLRRMPDQRLLDQLAEAQAKSVVRAPGIELPPPTVLEQSGCNGPLHIIWAARWEHDKAPEALLAALEKLAEQAIDFRLSVIGESFRESPTVFETIRERFAEKIIRWGFQPTRQEYWHALAAADVFVSTAEHEFFGLAAVEAAAVGTRVLLPERLAYPEVFGLVADNMWQQYFYDGTVTELAKKLSELAGKKQTGDPADFTSSELTSAMKRYHWQALVPQYDAELALLL